MKRSKQSSNKSTTKPKGDTMKEQTEDGRPETGTEIETQSPPPEAPAPEVTTAPEPTNNKAAKKYVIDFDIYHANGATEFKQIVAEAQTEEAAFDSAAKKLSALNTDEHPITWHYRGSFKVV